MKKLSHQTVQITPISKIVFYDSLYVKSLSISNIDDRKLLYEKMDSIIINEAPVVPLYYDMAVRFVNKKVTGLGINPQNFLVLKRVKKSN